MAEDWTDLIVGERMAVDQEFEENVAASHFSRQQWSLVMTAVEFEIENPAEPDSARLVTKTEKLPSVMGELERVDHKPGPGTGGASAGGAGGGAGGSGVLDSLKAALGLGEGTDREQLAAAEELAQMYADDLQAKIEARGKWEQVCGAASE